MLIYCQHGGIDKIGGLSMKQLAYLKFLANEIRKNNNDKKDNLMLYIQWREFFVVYCAELNIAKKPALILFQHELGSNWKDLWKEETQYAPLTTEQIRNLLLCEVTFIYNFPYLDRLFRTHWLFANAFSNDEYYELREKIKPYNQTKWHKTFLEQFYKNTLENTNE